MKMDPIALRHIRKRFFDGTHRVQSPEETYATVKPLMEQIGVHEVIDVTHLDRLGLPVFCAIRPRAAQGATAFHAGKGKEPILAEISAMMEAVERFSAEYRRDHMEVTSYEELGIRRALDPHDLILPRSLEVGEKLHWTPSWDIVNEEAIHVPSNAVFHPYDSMGIVQPLFRSDTNGLASGNVIEEAILHAMLEVVERDALSTAERDRSLGCRLLLEKDGPAREMMQMFEDHGIDIHLWILNGKTRLPTVAAAADDTVTRDPAMLVIGSGTHTSPEIAALRALTEVAQSRGSYLQGGRNEPGREHFLQKAGYERLKRLNRMWFADAEEIGIGEVPDLSTAYIDEDIAVCLQEIEPYSERVLVCDLTRTVVPVVRVIIPGFEVSYMDSTRTRRKEA
ncbi:MAG: YcaO-related McrA-glycine thioamidation protein [Methanomicrobiaceae archaeon]|nr:YcaO-related McrA-glycine thioamidation protein [Methanomicrobiaceae archaeon]